jgi:hypothetical protein
MQKVIAEKRSTFNVQRWLKAKRGWRPATSVPHRARDQCKRRQIYRSAFGIYARFGIPITILTTVAGVTVLLVLR